MSRTMWKEMSSRVITSFSHIYVRVIFSIALGQDVIEALKDDELSTSDKIAFACRLLSDFEVRKIIHMNLI